MVQIVVDDTALLLVDSQRLFEKLQIKALTLVPSFRALSLRAAEILSSILRKVMVAIITPDSKLVIIFHPLK